VARLDDFEEVWGVDFEFRQPDGERPHVLCMVAKEMRTGRMIRLWRDELLRWNTAPFRTDARVLVVAFYASAEINCFLSLGWPRPANLLCPYAEYSLITSGLTRPHGRGFLGVLLTYGIKGGVNVLYKDEMRDLCQRPGDHSYNERRDILDYCQTDVDPLGPLLTAMRPAIESPPTLSPGEHYKALGQALLRGDYVVSVGEMEYRGVPVDVPGIGRLLTEWPKVERAYIEDVDRPFGVYEEGSFVLDLFDRYLARLGIAWPRTKEGKPEVKEKTFREHSLIYPHLAPLHELRMMLDQMKSWKLAVGSDGRAR
jgi:hypothetical protein